MNRKINKGIIAIATVFLVFVMASFPALAVSYPDVNAYDSTTTLRGVQGEQNYGSQHAFFNFDIRRCYLPDSYPPCGIPYYEFEGKQYRFFDAVGIFSWLRSQNYAGRTTNVQFMISWEDATDDANLWQGSYPLRRILIDPAVQNKTGAYYYAPASTGEGKQIMRAFWSWLMTELSNRQLHIDNFILGNEVNAPIYWHYSGECTWTEKAQKYAISFYDMRQIIRSFSDKPRISICLDHSWYHNDEGRGITARDYLSVFDSTLTGLNNNKKVDDWCISMHLYPAVLTWPLIWTDKPGYPPNLNPPSEYASFVDGKNLSYITNYIKNTYGENHRIMLTEQGFTSHLGEVYQAASLVYSYYAAKYDPMVDCFILMVADSGAELQFSIDGKMAGQIYPKIDDPTIQSYVDSNLLPVIGVSSWSQIVPNYGQSIVRKTYVGSGSKYVIEAGSSIAEGGSVAGAGTYEKGQEVTLTATPAKDYEFVAWMEGDNVVSTDATYVFTVEKKRSLVAEFEKVEPLDKSNPVLIGASASDDDITVSWNANSGVFKYAIFRKVGSGKWAKAGETTGSGDESVKAEVGSICRYCDVTALAGTTYTYTVRGISEDGKYITTFDATGVSAKIEEPLDKSSPKLQGASASASDITISWTANNGVFKYAVFRKVGSGKWTKISETTGSGNESVMATAGSNCSYRDMTAKVETNYTYTVRGMSEDGKYVTSFDATGVSAKINEPLDQSSPKLQGASASDSDITVSWTANSGVFKYAVFRKIGSGKWTKVGETTGSGNESVKATAGSTCSYRDVTAQVETNYTYTVRGINKNGKYVTSFDATGVSAKINEPLDKSSPKLQGASASTEGITVSWTANSGVFKYAVFRKVGSGKWTKLGETTGSGNESVKATAGSTCSYLDTTAKANITYTYAVRGIDEQGKYITSFDANGVSCKK